MGNDALPRIGTRWSIGWSAPGKLTPTAGGSCAQGWYWRVTAGVAVGTSNDAMSWTGNTPIVGITRVAVGALVGVGAGVAVQVASGTSVGPSGTRELAAVGVAVGGAGACVGVGGAGVPSHAPGARPPCGPCRSQ